MSDHTLLLLAVAVVGGLVLLIAVFRINAVLALFAAAMAMGWSVGLPLLPSATSSGVMGAIGIGFWKTLASLAAIIAFGGALGGLLAESGAAGRVAEALLERVGTRNLDVALMLVGFGVGISVFFTVGMLLLGPLVWSLARDARLPVLRLALPLAAGLSVAQGLIPPHPGPMAAIAMVHADVGRTILYSLFAGLPTALLAGPMLARWLVREESSLADATPVFAPRTEPRSSVLPGLGTSLVAMLLPVGLMLAPFVAELFGLPTGHPLERLVANIGRPWVAMLGATGLAVWTLGFRCQRSTAELWKWIQATLRPSGELLFIIGAGGAFSHVLQVAGVGRALINLGVLGGVSPLLVGWILAASLRVAVGSATVSVITAAGLMQPMLDTHPQLNRELLVLAMGAGSLVCSHVNDSGFWLIRGYFRLGIGRTLRTWTVVETAIGVAGLLILMLIEHVS
ncbi:MAG: permease DsdX [Opitutae bacterium]|nr:permease DsdX [Opitutae bacterium]